MDLGLSSLVGLVCMGKSQKALPPQVRAWVEAGRRHRLSHAQVQMAREPGKARQDQQPPARAVEGAAAAVHRAPLLKRFGRDRPRIFIPAEKWERPTAAKKPA
jgi:hypothetical protein